MTVIQDLLIRFDSVFLIMWLTTKVKMLIITDTNAV